MRAESRAVVARATACYSASPMVRLLGLCLLVATYAVGAERPAFLLQYIGTDYGDAVRDGSVVDPTEFGEQVRFARQLVREYEAHPRRSAMIARRLKAFAAAVEHQDSAERVWSWSRRLLPKLDRTLGTQPVEPTAPNLANARRRWADDCAPCHGGNGAGDGPAAPGMLPPPTAFRGPYLDRLAPRRVFDALVLGLDGTAMPSFSQAYTDRQRWDLAFFVMTLRADFAPRRPAVPVTLGLDTLARASNPELLATLRARDPTATIETVDYVRQHPSATSGGAADATAVAVGLQDAFAEVAERLTPFVVSVSGWVADPEWSAERVRARQGDTWMSANLDEVRYPGYRRVGTGSGLLMDADGYVLTADAVVRDTHGAPVPLVDVELPSQLHLASTLVGSEPTLDLAVVQLPAVGTSALPTGVAMFGDSDQLQVGHWVIALGDPPGPERIFSVGTVSAPAERQCYQAQMTATRIQTSLDLPTGALGGPIVNIQGEVVGLTVRQGSDPSSRLHTIPINLALNVSEALKVSHARQSPWIGTSVLELPLLRARLGPAARTHAIPPTGVYVDDVFDPSPAARAGVRPGDFLLAMNGQRIFSVGDFQTWLHVAGIGNPLTLELLRDGGTVRVTLAVAPRPPSATTR